MYSADCAKNEKVEDSREEIKVELSQYASVSERYYVSRYCTDVNGRLGEDMRILFHNNGICVVMLALSHPLLAQKKTITGVNFQVTENLNRMDNKPSGKGKKGGQWMAETSPLCKVTCSDDSVYTLFGCVRGKLVEVNSDLSTDPLRLQLKSQTEGYIGIVLPRLGHSKPQLNSLLKPEEYRQKVNNRLTELCCKAASSGEPEKDCSAAAVDAGTTLPSV